ncbi:MAG: hypothetical protein R2861_00605 [Desulfobacterales bacterium]
MFIARARWPRIGHFVSGRTYTANIDSQGRTYLYNLLKELNKTKTIFVVSHDTMVLSSYVGRGRLREPQCPLP